MPFFRCVRESFADCFQRGSHGSVAHPRADCPPRSGIPSPPMNAQVLGPQPTADALGRRHPARAGRALENRDVQLGGGGLAEGERTEEDIAVEGEPVEVGLADGGPPVVDDSRLGVQVDGRDPRSRMCVVVGPAGEDADPVRRRGADLLDQAGLTSGVEHDVRLDVEQEDQLQPGLVLEHLGQGVGDDRVREVLVLQVDEPLRLRRSPAGSSRGCPSRWSRRGS